MTSKKRPTKKKAARRTGDASPVATPAVLTVQAVKPWWQSKTLWFNALVIVGGVVAYLEGQIGAGEAVTAIGIAGAILRSVTSTKLQAP